MTGHLAKEKICGGKTSRREPCLRPAGWGTQHPGEGRCAVHGGNTPNGVMAASKEELKGMAKPIAVGPDQALTAVLHLAVGQLVYSTEKVNGLSEDELFHQAYHPASETFTMVPHHWLALQRMCMADLAKFAKMCADADINERGQLLAEQQTAVVAQVLERVVGSLDLTREQREQLGPAIRRELTAMPTTPDVEGVPT
jgi:hypothetical protein